MAIGFSFESDWLRSHDEVRQKTKQFRFMLVIQLEIALNEVLCIKFCNLLKFDFVCLYIP